MKAGCFLRVNIQDIRSFLDEVLQRSCSFTSSSIVDGSSHVGVLHIEVRVHLDELFQDFNIRVDASEMQRSHSQVGGSFLGN